MRFAAQRYIAYNRPTSPTTYQIIVMPTRAAALHPDPQEHTVYAPKPLAFGANGTKEQTGDKRLKP